MNALPTDLDPSDGYRMEHIVAATLAVIAPAILGVVTVMTPELSRIPFLALLTVGAVIWVALIVQRGTAAQARRFDERLRQQSEQLVRDVERALAKESSRSAKRLEKIRDEMIDATQTGQLQQYIDAAEGGVRKLRSMP